MQELYVRQATCVEASIVCWYLIWQSTKESYCLCMNRAGEELCLFDGRPNGELLLSTGTTEDENPSDYLEFEVELVQTERLYLAKRDILQAMGYDVKEQFPVYKTRMPLQLLSYLRLSRVTDAAVLTKVFI